MEPIIDELHTLGDFIRWGASQFEKAELFFGHGTDNTIDEAIVLVSHVLHLPSEIPDILWHSRVVKSEKQEILKLFDRRIQERIPAAYLTDEAWFADIRFYVDQRVLIPRSPIAELIRQQFEPFIKVKQVGRMLDLCTGSGCIAIACAMLAFPHAMIDAVDLSNDALEVAQKNIKHYGLEQRVHAFHSDLFSALAGKKYDLILCNPPYVDAQELRNMPAEYRHEPKLGLEAGTDGLFFVKKILRQAAEHLTDKGILIAEVGVSQTSLIEEYPMVPFLWLDFQQGGNGVFLLTVEQLRNYCCESIV
jgi:ribosomal protein L3 glutamine methyltransferase